MRMLMNVSFPHEPFNAAVRAGTAGESIQRILAELKPEAVYFTEYDGRRTALLVVDVPSPSRIPAFAEPWFLAFGADCRFQVVMSPDELASAGLPDLGKKWGGGR
ncbi:MAG: panthothenate synthetase [Planctomycetes bacterium]|nr:panthothenate synthetase [Planctomycetota bacterium]